MKQIFLLMLMLFNTASLRAQHQNALDFDGIDDYVVVANASGLVAGSAQMSITCWVYPTNPAPGWPDFDGFAGIRNEVDADFYLLQFTDTSIEARFRNSAGAYFNIEAGGMLLNTWQHYAMTYDGAMLRIYRNGQLTDSLPANGTITNPVESLWIGDMLYQGTHYYLGGRMDEVSLWNTALSPADVTCIYEDAIDPVAPGLRLYYRFNQGIAGGNNVGVDMLQDATGNINGVLQGFFLSGPASNWITGVPNFTADSAVICPGDTFAFHGQALTASGSYTAYVPAGGVCDSVIELTLAVTDTSVNTTTLLHANQNGATYQWLRCDSGYASIPGANMQNFAPATGGTFAVAITFGGCTDTSGCHVFSLTGTAPGFLPVPFSVYPNPVTDRLTIAFDASAAGATVTAHDIAGRQLVARRVQGTTIDIDTRDWKPGMYFLAIEQPGSMHCFRVVRNGL